MAYPTFTSGANSFVFIDTVALPTRRPLEKIQARDRTAAGSLQVEDLGVSSIRSFPLTIMGLSASEMSALETWWDTIANGSLNEFTYSDENGTSYQVLWVSDKLAFVEVDSGIYNGEIMLEVVG